MSRKLNASFGLDQFISISIIHFSYPFILLHINPSILNTENIQNRKFLTYSLSLSVSRFTSLHRCAGIVDFVS
jgi:hypothetical protein